MNPTPRATSVKAAEPLVELSAAVLPALPGERAPAPMNWTVRTGEWWLLLGSHSGGPSALLSVVAGLRPAVSGQVTRFLAGNPGSARSESPASSGPGTGYVFEHGGRLLHRLSVAENIVLPLRYHQDLSWQEVEPRLEALLEFVGLRSLAGATPGQLRPWQRQRAALARALAQDPELLLLDNPTAGLSPLEIGWWQTALGALHAGQSPVRKTPVTLVLACEDPRPWWGRATRFGLLEGGSWEDLGSRDQVAPRREELWRLLGGGG